jgi:hypothetical protein
MILTTSKITPAANFRTSTTLIQSRRVGWCVFFSRRLAFLTLITYLVLAGKREKG